MEPGLHKPHTKALVVWASSRPVPSRQRHRGCSQQVRCCSQRYSNAFNIKDSVRPNSLKRSPLLSARFGEGAGHLLPCQELKVPHRLDRHPTPGLCLQPKVHLSRVTDPKTIQRCTPKTPAFTPGTCSCHCHCAMRWSPGQRPPKQLHAQGL